MRVRLRFNNKWCECVLRVRVLNKRLEPEIDIFTNCNYHRHRISLKMDIHWHVATAITKIENGPKVLQVDDNFACVHDPIDSKFFDGHSEHCFTPEIFKIHLYYQSNSIIFIWKCEGKQLTFCQHHRGECNFAQ